LIPLSLGSKYSPLFFVPKHSICVLHLGLEAKFHTRIKQQLILLFFIL
jgi:hypothetical protein